MKICVFGAGAIGGYLAAKLAASDHEVSLVARGDHLAAIRDRGLTLIEEGETSVARLSCAQNAAELGEQQCVFVTLKAPSVPAAIDGIVSLLTPETTIVTAQNGIPWWYFYRHGGELDNHRIESVDPGGGIWTALGGERAIGCVVYPSCEIVEPGVIRHLSGRRFMLGEPDGSKSERVIELSRLLTAAGLKAPIRRRIRDDIWLKLWGNVSFNPVSALTLATLGQICAEPTTRELIRRIMAEAEAIARALGIRFPVDLEQRIRWAEDVGDHKTSMLQDLELGRPMEIDALVAAVVELGRLVSVAAPTIDAVLALLRLRAASR